MGAYGHPNCKPTLLFGTLPPACNSASFQCELTCITRVGWGACSFSGLRPYMALFRKKLTMKDKRRIAKNKAVKKHQMVKKSISKTTGRTVVSLGNQKTFCNFKPV